MTPHRPAWHWCVAFLALGAFVLLIVAATDDPGDPGAPTGEPATVTLDAFDGSAPAPTVTVDHATDLVDHQVVTVHGEGFDPAGSATLWQCFEWGGGCAADVTEIDDDGSFTRTVGITATGPSIDCRDPGPACTLTVQVYEQGPGEYRTVGAAPLQFDPEAALAPPPTLTATPLTGLADGDPITISGENFRPGDPLDAIICGGPRLFEEGCEAVPSGSGNVVDAAGRLEHVFRATARPPGYDDLDCRRDDCWLVVGSGFEHATSAFPLEFEPDGAIAPPPEAFALVVEGRDLRVQGEGFLPGEEVYTGVCIERDDEPRQCHAPTPHHTTADGDGAIDSTFTPEPFDGFAGVEDCRDSRCWVVVEGTSLPHRNIDLNADFALDP